MIESGDAIRFAPRYAGSYALLFPTTSPSGGTALHCHSAAGKVPTQVVADPQAQSYFDASGYWRMVAVIPVQYRSVGTSITCEFSSAGPAQWSGIVVRKLSDL
jgi:hypothetical protein